MKSTSRWFLVLVVTAGLGISYSWAEIYVKEPPKYIWSAEIESCDFVKVFKKMAMEVTKRGASPIYYELVSRNADGNRVEIKINNCKLAKVSKEEWRYTVAPEGVQFKFIISETDITVDIPGEMSSRVSMSMSVYLTIELDTYNIPRALLEDLYRSSTIQSLRGEMVFFGYGPLGEPPPPKPEDLYFLRARIRAEVLNGVVLE